MGGGGAPPDGGGGGGGSSGGGTDYTSLFQQIIDALTGPLIENTDLITVGTAAVALYPNAKLVYKVTIQNLSSTDIVTIKAVSNAQGIVSPIAAGKGVLLNAANASGQGGGSATFGGILGKKLDLSNFSAITNTNTGQTIAVHYEY